LHRLLLSETFIIDFPLSLDLFYFCSLLLLSFFLFLLLFLHLFLFLISLLLVKFLNLLFFFLFLLSLILFFLIDQLSRFLIELRIHHFLPLFLSYIILTLHSPFVGLPFLYFVLHELVIKFIEIFIRMSDLSNLFCFQPILEFFDDCWWFPTSFKLLLRIKKLLDNWVFLDLRLKSKLTYHFYLVNWPLIMHYTNSVDHTLKRLLFHELLFLFLLGYFHRIYNIIYLLSIRNLLSFDQQGHYHHY
jgi:hypothetical protein